MKEKKNTGISVFQRYLTLWVILCMAAGVAIGKYLPEIPDFLNRFEYAGISIPMALLIWLISTDPASNLQDVFNRELDNKGTNIPEVPNLTVANLDPIKAAAEYRESVIAPYRGKLPDSVIANMEEQLSGSCTVEIAAFNEFSGFITNAAVQQKYDYIIFDTAPTGHTLGMLQLPSAWSNFISESTHGASCLGQLSGRNPKRLFIVRLLKRLRTGN